MVEQKYKEIEEKQEEKNEERRTSIAGVPPGLGLNLPPVDHRRAMSVTTPPREEELRPCLTDRSKGFSLFLNYLTFDPNFLSFFF